MDEIKKETVENKYEINEIFLEELSRRGRKTSFFSKSLKFYREVKAREILSLSEKQLNWLNEIQSILHDREQNEIKGYDPRLKSTAEIKVETDRRELLAKNFSQEDEREESIKVLIEDQSIDLKLKKETPSWISLIITKIKNLF